MKEAPRKILSEEYSQKNAPRRLFPEGRVMGGGAAVFFRKAGEAVPYRYRRGWQCSIPLTNSY